MESFGKWAMIAGLALFLAGMVILVFPKTHFLGRLPGDIRIEKENFSFYFPIATCLLISAILSLILWIFNKR